MGEIIDIFKQNNIVIDEQQERQFLLYRSFLKEYNEKVNLTAITDDKEIIIKHFLDSAVGEKYIPQNGRVADVGTGAGFPALPIKIVRPDLSVTLIDSLQKRIVFLEETIKLIGLEGVEAEHMRAEESAKKYREQFDCVVARAVASLPTLLEYCLPLVKVGGLFIAYKGDVKEEIISSKRALSVLGGKVEKTDAFCLPDGSQRTLVVVKKVSKTPPMYPRLQNKPKNMPL